MSRYIDGGRNGDCLWTIDKDYTLLIEPLENTNGILDNYSYDGYEWPWTYYASDIRKVVIKNGVTANRDISFMFSGMENCEDFDIASLDVSKVKTANGLCLGCHSPAGLSTLSPTSELTHRLC